MRACARYNLPFVFSFNYSSLACTASHTLSHDLHARFGFNCGSLYVQPNVGSISNTGEMVDRIALNMTLAAAMAGLTALFISSVRSGGAGCNRGARVPSDRVGAGGQGFFTFLTNVDIIIALLYPYPAPIPPNRHL